MTDEERREIEAQMQWFVDRGYVEIVRIEDDGTKVYRGTERGKREVARRRQRERRWES